MIIIATNNGKEYLEKLLPTISYDYAVIDTGSTEYDSIQYFNSLNCKKAQISGGYCVGAYQHGYKMFPDNEYFFMHDSMIVKKKNFLEDFSIGEVVAWIGFKMDYLNHDEYLTKLYNDLSDMPEYAIFGPIFYATSWAMSQINPPIPDNRKDAIAMERGYAFAFHRAGIKIKYLEEYNNERIDIKKDYIYSDKLRPNRR